MRLAASFPTGAPHEYQLDSPSSSWSLIEQAPGPGYDGVHHRVAVVAVAAIGVYSLLGQTICNQTAGIAQEIAGNDGGSAISAASSNANSARLTANSAKGLRNFNEDNRQ